MEITYSNKTSVCQRSNEELYLKGIDVVVKDKPKWHLVGGRHVGKKGKLLIVRHIDGSSNVTFSPQIF